MTDTSNNALYDDPAARERAIRYSRTKEWLVLVGTIWTTLVNLAALGSGASARLRDRARFVGCAGALSFTFAIRPSLPALAPKSA